MRIGSKNKKRKSIFALFSVFLLGTALFCGILFSSGRLDIQAALVGNRTEIEKLGNLQHYNGVLFGNFTSTSADVEGALAVGGDYTLMGLNGYGYDVGGAWQSTGAGPIVGHYDNPEKYPTVLLNTEDINFGAGLGETPKQAVYNIYGGNVVFSDSLYHKFKNLNISFEKHGGTTGEETVSDELADRWFKEQYQLAKAASGQYVEAGKNTKTISMNTFGAPVWSNPDYKPEYLTMNPEVFRSAELESRTGNGKKILVINVDAPVSVEISWTYYLTIDMAWSNEYDLIVYNFPETVNVSCKSAMNLLGFSKDPNYPSQKLTAAENEARNNACQKIIWNFPKAQNIDLEQYLLWGTLLAPEASVDANGGSINGQLIAKDLYQSNSFELHSFKLTGTSTDVVETEDEETEVEILKQLYYEGERTVPVEGAEFELYTWSGSEKNYVRYKQETYRTDHDGKISGLYLPDGKYKLTETKAPPGFTLNMNKPGQEYDYYELEFEVSDKKSNGSFIQNDGKGLITIQRYNELLRTDVQFTKVKEDGGGLDGAKFILWREGDEYLDGFRIYPELVSSGGGQLKFENLPAGKYILEEIEAPDGYTRADAISFSIEVNGNSLAVKGLENLEGNKIVNVSGETKNLVQIFKYDEESEEGYETGLQGAEYDLWKYEENQWIKINPEDYSLEKFMTDSRGICAIQNLAPGAYRLVEIKAPEGGYIVENKYKATDQFVPEYFAGDFEVSQKKEEVYFVGLTNKKSRTEFTLKKGTNLYEGGLGGAGFTLYKEQNGEKRVVSSTLTDENGEICFSGLETGDYVLKESIVPEGYQQWQELEFTIDLDNEGNMIFQSADARSNFKRDKNGRIMLEIVNEAYANYRLELVKIDKDVFQDGITGVDEKIHYYYTYLEGAEFQLYRYNERIGIYQVYDMPVPSAKAGEFDEEGREIAAAAWEGIPYGLYQVRETAYPDGYEGVRESNIVASFTISADMAKEKETIKYTVTNAKISARSEIKVQKIDRADDRPLAETQFQLWTIQKGAEDWESDITIQDVMPQYDDLTFAKYASGGYVTGADGWVSLGELEPGIYALFESEPPGGADSEYMYLTQLHSTRPDEFDLSFYIHLTVFKVVQIEEDDTEKGVRIQWVLEEKLMTDEARFDNEKQDVDNKLWNEASFKEKDYRTFQVTNRKLEIPGITFEKQDTNTKEPLPGAEFTLYKWTDGETEEVNKYISGPDGKIEIPSVDLQLGKYLLKETKAPDGYVLSGWEFSFEIGINVLTKGIDLYQLDESGNSIYVNKAGTGVTAEAEEALDAGLGPVKYPMIEGYKAPEEGSPKGTAGTLLKVFTLNKVYNARGQGSFRLLKELEKPAGKEEHFVFQVVRLKDGEEKEVFYGTVIVKKGEYRSEVLFSDLPYGTYIITEILNNWRYVADEEEIEKTIEITADSPSVRVSFKNKKTKNNWIGFNNFVTNKMKTLYDDKE